MLSFLYSEILALIEPLIKLTSHLVLVLGRLVNGFGTFVPLKAAYTLYRSLGEPHTVRQFLRAVRNAPHINYLPQPPITEPPDECIPMGRNLYIFGDEMSFIVGKLRYNDDVLSCK